MNFTYALGASAADWFTEAGFYLPNWVWCVICAVVLIAVIVIIAVAVNKCKKKKQATAESDEIVTAEEDAETSGTVVKEEVQEEPQAEKIEKEEVAEKVEKTEKAEKAEKTEKTEKAEKAEKTEKENTVAAADKTAADSKAKSTKTYHISKRKDMNKWQVKTAGGAKAVKLFTTQAEAIEYAKKLAENQDANIIIHKVDGSFRKLKY